MIFSVLQVQDRNLSSGSEIINILVSRCCPKRILISSKPPSEFNLDQEIISFLLMDSRGFRGFPMVWMVNTAVAAYFSGELILPTKYDVVPSI